MLYCASNILICDKFNGHFATRVKLKENHKFRGNIIKIKTLQTKSQDIANFKDNLCYLPYLLLYFVVFVYCLILT